MCCDPPLHRSTKMYPHGWQACGGRSGPSRTRRYEWIRRASCSRLYCRACKTSLPPICQSSFRRRDHGLLHLPAVHRLRSGCSTSYLRTSSSSLVARWTHSRMLSLHRGRTHSSPCSLRSHFQSRAVPGTNQSHHSSKVVARCPSLHSSFN